MQDEQLWPRACLGMISTPSSADTDFDAFMQHLVGDESLARLFLPEREGRRRMNLSKKPTPGESRPNNTTTTRAPPCFKKNIDLKTT